ncbi:hypothetical protein DPV73_02470 [Leptospira mayottensis]|nr:hypothetical protein DPV73_02470 [Leptospira mayottensis]
MKNFPKSLPKNHSKSPSQNLKKISLNDPVSFKKMWEFPQITSHRRFILLLCGFYCHLEL